MEQDIFYRVPNDGFWKARVNGGDREAIGINGFTAVPVMPGKMRLTLCMYHGRI